MNAQSRRAKLKRENTMKYILMMNCPRNGYELMGTMPQKAVQDHMAFMHQIGRAHV